MRTPLPDETVPVELVGAAHPSIEFSGRAPLTFEPRPGDGRRVEWTTPAIANVLLADPYNRSGRAPLFRVADDLLHTNIDQQVIEAIHRYAGLVRQILQIDTAEPVEAESEPEEDVDLLGLRDDDPQELISAPAQPQAPDSVEDMDKLELIGFAKEREIPVDARWSRAKILEVIQRQEVVGV